MVAKLGDYFMLLFIIKFVQFWHSDCLSKNGSNIDLYSNLFYISAYTSVTKNSRGTFYASCAVGSQVLFCGDQNTQTLNRETFRSAKPLNSTTCQCYDYFGMQCRAWCTSAPVKNFQAVAVTSSGTFVANCPAGKLALGCHTNPAQANPEDWRIFAPNLDGSGCTCYDYFGTTCVTTCASNVFDYEVNLVIGSGNVYSGCKIAGNTVLGCGSDPDLPNTTGYEAFRTTGVVNSTYCMCYDYFHAKCYSICGKIY